MTVFLIFWADCVDLSVLPKIRSFYFCIFFEIFTSIFLQFACIKIVVHVLVCACVIAHIKWRRLPLSHKRERKALNCFNEKVQINNVKMETFSFYPPACLPIFSNCGQHKPNKFVLAALNSLHKLHGFCI